MESYNGVMDGMKDNDNEYFSALGFKADSEKDRKLFFSSLIDHEAMCCKVGACVRLHSFSALLSHIPSL